MISALPDMGGASVPRSELGTVPDAAPVTHSHKPAAVKGADPSVSGYAAHPADGARRLIGAGIDGPTAKDVKKIATGIAKESAEAFLEGDKSIVHAVEYGAGKFLGGEIGMAPTEAVVTDVCSDLGYAPGTEAGESCKEMGVTVLDELFASAGFALPEGLEHLIGPFTSGLVEGILSKGLPGVVLAESYYRAKAWDKATGFSNAMSGEKAKPLHHPARPGMEYLPDENFEEDCKPSRDRPGMEECKLR